MDETVSKELPGRRGHPEERRRVRCEGRQGRRELRQLLEGPRGHNGQGVLLVLRADPPLPKLRRTMHQDVLRLMDGGLRTGMIEYMRSMGLRAESFREVPRLLGGVDALIMPTCLIAAPRIDEILGSETGRSAVPPSAEHRALQHDRPPRSEPTHQQVRAVDADRAPGGCEARPGRAGPLDGGEDLGGSCTLG